MSAFSEFVSYTRISIVRSCKKRTKKNGLIVIVVTFYQRFRRIVQLTVPFTVYSPIAMIMCRMFQYSDRKGLFQYGCESTNDDIVKMVCLIAL